MMMAWLRRTGHRDTESFDGPTPEPENTQTFLAKGSPRGSGTICSQ